MYISPSFYTFYKRYPSSHHLFYNGKAACKPIKWRKSRIGNNKNYDIYKILANYATHLKGEYIYPCYNVILLVTLVTNVWTVIKSAKLTKISWFNKSAAAAALLSHTSNHSLSFSACNFFWLDFRVCARIIPSMFFFKTYLKTNILQNQRSKWIFCAAHHFCKSPKAKASNFKAAPSLMTTREKRL